MTYPFPWQFDRARYSERYLMSQVTEADVQRDVLELLHLYSVDGIAIDAGGRRQRGRMTGAAKKAGIDLASIPQKKAWYAIPSGFSDLEATLAPNGRALYIEIKAPAWLDERFHVIRAPGKPSEEQLLFLQSKYDRGAVVLVAWCVSDVEKYCDVELRANRRALR